MKKGPLKIITIPIDLIEYEEATREVETDINNRIKKYEMRLQAFQ